MMSVREFPLIFPLLLLFAVFMPISAAQGKGSGPNLPQPGFRSIGLWDPETPMRMDIAVWYPSARNPHDILLEGWAIRAGRNGAVTPGRYPVILLSHGTASSRLALHDLAALLARNGFMVIAPTHPGDNADDTRASFRASLFADRPAHLLTALEAVAKNADLRPFMDRSRIGVLGVGAGAATALQLAGALPDLSGLPSHCPETPALDPLCSGWAKEFHPRMQKEFAQLAAARPEALVPVIFDPSEPLPKNASAAEPAFARTGPEAPATSGASEEKEEKKEDVAQTPGAPGPAGEDAAPVLPPAGRKARPILAVGLLAPGLVDLFPDTSLQPLTASVGIFAAMDDEVYPPARSVERLQQFLPQRPASRVLRNAGHMDIQAPCPPKYQESFPALYGKQGPAADDAREMRNDFFVRFFKKTLGEPEPLPPS